MCSNYGTCTYYWLELRIVIRSYPICISVVAISLRLGCTRVRVGSRKKYVLKYAGCSRRIRTHDERGDSRAISVGLHHWERKGLYQLSRHILYKKLLIYSRKIYVCWKNCYCTHVILAGTQCSTIKYKYWSIQPFSNTNDMHYSNIGAYSVIITSITKVYISRIMSI